MRCCCVSFLLPDQRSRLRRSSTSHLYLDISIDFTGYFLAYDCAARQHEWRPRGHCMHHPPCRFVRTSTLGSSSSSSPASPTVVLPHSIRSDQPTCVIHPAPVTSVLIDCAPSPSTEDCRCVDSLGSSDANCGLLRVASSPLLATSTTSSPTSRRCALRTWSSSCCLPPPRPLRQASRPLG